MKKYAYNPILPLDKYIPDGEPHVFDGRVYLFGSHDREGGNTFCELDYEFFSAPIDDLSNWSSNGINYCSKQMHFTQTKDRICMHPMLSAATTENIISTTALPEKREAADITVPSASQYAISRTENMNISDMLKTVTEHRLINMFALIPQS